MTKEEKIKEILNCERCKKVIALSGATCSSPCSNFKDLLKFAAWKDEQIILFLEKIEGEAVDTTTANYLKKAIEGFKSKCKNESN